MIAARGQLRLLQEMLARGERALGTLSPRNAETIAKACVALRTEMEAQHVDGSELEKHFYAVEQCARSAAGSTAPATDGTRARLQAALKAARAYWNAERS